ncbi:MAG: hypothetical protein JW829_17125, partial [Pirellulales bacterium]|nr:hypothetical protein [Pirellulales bacterium]
ADGRVSLPGLPRQGLSSVQVTSEMYGTWIQMFALDKPIPPVTTIRLPAAGRVEGRLIADDPKLIRGVRMHLSTYGSPFQNLTLPSVPGSGNASAPSTSLPSFGVAEAVSDNEGHFVVPAIPEGKLKVRVQIDKHLPHRAQVIGAEELTVFNPNITQMEIHIRPTASKEGT